MGVPVPEGGSAPVGAVLCGGTSRRMGRDKALVEVEGRALAARVADALRAGGCRAVLAVGGDGPALAALGLDPVPDRWPGAGPLAGLATALSVGGGGLMVVAPCDLVAPEATTVATLVGTLAAAPGDVVAAAPVDERGRPAWIHAAWRAGAAAPVVAALVEGGARRLDAVATAVRWVSAATIDPVSLRDADRQEDLPRP